MRRITLVGPTYPFKGGISQHTTSLAEHLEVAGCDVDLLSWSAQYPRRLYPGDLEVGTAGSEREFPGTRRSLAWYDPGSWWRAAKGPSRCSDLVVFTVVNGIQVPAYRTILQRVRRRGIRTVALCHNVHPHEADAVQIRFLTHFLRNVDAVMVHSDREADKARALGARSVEVCRMPFHFPAAGTPRDVDSPPTRRLLAFGFVRPYKGIDVLIDSLAVAHTQVEATVAGEFWVSADDLRDRAVRRGVGPRVHIRPGYLEPSAVLELLAEHDAVVLPYRSGSGSQQPRLAFMTGTPVIASRVGDLTEQIHDGVDGLLVDPGSSASLAAAIDRLYEPGVLFELRRQIRPPDVAAEWSRYVDALVGA